MTTRTPPIRATRTPSTPRKSSDERTALARCVEPLSPAAFLADHWEQRPFVAERDGAARFDDLLSVADVEQLVASGGLRQPAFRLVKAGEQIPPSDYTVDIPWRPVPFSKTADIAGVAAAFADGATIVVQGLHHWWQPLARFCRHLEAELGHPAQANAYYTPRDSQGLPVHHDTHDVFVLQVAGEKRWRVYEPAWELPLRDQRYAPEMGGPGEPVLDVALRPGATLYLPRGWLHEATTSSVDSLHLTVGVNVYTWMDAARAALAELADDVALRASVPADGTGGEDVAALLAERLRPDDVARRMEDRFIRTRRPILDDQIAQVRALDRLDLETRLERRPTVIAKLEARDAAVALVFEGKELVFPAHARAAVEDVVEADGAFRARDLAGDLDEDGRLVLVRRLVREGFLRLESPSTPAPGRDGSPRRSGADAAGSSRRT